MTGRVHRTSFCALGVPGAGRNGHGILRRGRVEVGRVAAGGLVQAGV